MTTKRVGSRTVRKALPKTVPWDDCVGRSLKKAHGSDNKRNSRRNSKNRKPHGFKRTPCVLRGNAQIVPPPSPLLLRRVPARYTFGIGSKQSVLLCDWDRKKEMEGLSRVVDALVDLQSSSCHHSVQHDINFVIPLA